MDSTSSLNHQAPERWAFDADVAGCFDDMLQRSIPQYDVMRSACFDLAQRFVQRDTDIVDLGCSRGEGLASFVDKYGAYNRYIGVDNSVPMLEACRLRFKGWIDTGLLRIMETDLRKDYPRAHASVTLAVLTLQFVPIEYRHQVVQKIYDNTAPGGCIILVEKILAPNANLNQVMLDNYLAFKQQNGYSLEQIETKRQSLEGVLVPVTAQWNTDLLKSAGFNQVECFWRWMNFAGWVAAR
jgi:tRNA (cmo5U34)-methyltransferase